MDAATRERLIEGLEIRALQAVEMLQFYIGTDAEVTSEFFWNAVKDGEFRPLVSNLRYLTRFPEKADCDVAIDYVTKIVLESPEVEEVSTNQDLTELLNMLAERFQDRFAASYERLPAPFDGLAFLALVGAGMEAEIPDHAVGTLAAVWLNSFGSAKDEYAAPIETIEEKRWGEALWSAATTPGQKIENWEVVRPLIEDRFESASVEERAQLAFNCQKGMRALAWELLKPMPADGGARLEALLEEDRLRGRSDRQAFMEVIVALRALASRDIPETFHEVLKTSLAMPGKDDMECLRASLQPVEPTLLAEWIVEALTHSHSPCPRALFVTDMVSGDRRILKATLAHADRLERFDYLAERLVEALLAMGDGVTDGLIEAYDEQMSPIGARVLIAVLATDPTEKKRAALVQMLSHSSKEVRLAAQVVLARMGEAAREALESGTSAHAEGLLRRLEGRKNSPLQALDRQVEGFDDETTTAIRNAFEACGELKNVDVFRRRQKINEVLGPVVEEYGAAALLVLRDWFLDGFEEYRVVMAFKGALALVEDRSEAAWVAIDAYSLTGDHPSFKTADFLTNEGGIDGLEGFGDELCEPLSWALRGPEVYRTVDMYRLLLDSGPGVDAELVTMGLNHDSGEVRGLCIAALEEMKEGDAAALPESLREIGKLARALIAGGSRETRTLYFFERAPTTSASLNRLSGRPPGVTSKTWPRGREKMMKFICMIDLQSTPAMAKGLDTDARALALFVESPEQNEAWEPHSGQAAVVLLSEEQIAADSKTNAPGDFEVYAIDVPTSIFADPGEGLAKTLRQAVYGHPARAGGAPLWLQDEGHQGRFAMQFDERFVDINLGDAGVMYVFADTAFWQCH